MHLYIIYIFTDNNITSQTVKLQKCDMHVLHYIPKHVPLCNTAQMITKTVTTCNKFKLQQFQLSSNTN